MEQIISHKNMVPISGGTFKMGTPDDEYYWSEDGDWDEASDEKPQHQVTVSSFNMGKYPVTQAEYEAVMGQNPSNFKGPNLPVEDVTWFEAIDFCNKLSLQEGLSPAYTIKDKEVLWNQNSNGYRLPTEAEWEYACRAGTTSPYYTGDEITIEHAHFDLTFDKAYTRPVGSYGPNPWGLYDMQGNVSNWCWDWFQEYLNTAQTNPVGASSGADRVIRGGNCIATARYLRSAYRYQSDPSTRDYIGIRLVRP